MISKLLPGNETLLLVPAFEIGGIPQLLGATTYAPISAPTSAILNKWIPIVTNGTSGSGSGGNISCATSDDLNLGLTGSEKDDSRSLCSVGKSGTLTTFNFDAELNLYRDISLTASDSVYVMARDLVRAPDIPYILAHRIGYGQNVAAAAGQEWDFYYAWTDNEVPDYADGENQASNITFIPKNIVNIAYTLGS